MALVMAEREVRELFMPIMIKPRNCKADGKHSAISSQQSAFELIKQPSA